jgi:heat shock protein HslJ
MRTQLVLVAVAVAGLAGCAQTPKATTSPPKPPATVPTPPALPLESGSFTAELFGGGQYPKVTIRFEPGDHDTGGASGTAGCNRFNAGYTRTATTMTFGTIASTMMMCSATQMATEKKFFAFLGDVRTWHLDASNTLTLTTAKGEMQRFHRD